MATTKNNSQSPFTRQITDEAAQHLVAMKDELDKATADLKVLEQTGIDVTVLKERVDWGYKTVDILSKHFGRNA